ncbi:pyridoxal phosphate-dependent aminotransferase [Flagellimonas sp.]|jgi:histidinol-phosphate aminotransferase|uniref:pyridoxal phosphate-dependent aminotransferase n=1 Tax=Flagellimonas sp. TaxID=2058762 RepID=UPI003BAA438D
MKKVGRREWINTMALAGSGMLIEPAFGHHIPSFEGKHVSYLRLNANENPYGPSNKVREVIQKNSMESNRYPFDLSSKLIEKIASKEGLSTENFLLGAGSTELLQLLGQWLLMEDYCLTHASPTFEIIANYVKFFKGKVIKTDLDKDHRHDLDTMERESFKNPGAVYIVNPNNPTGTVLKKADLLVFCQRVTKHSYVIIDEAYIEYIGLEESLSSLVLNNPKIIILRTFSKIYGLAGLRIGYMMAHERTIGKLQGHQIWNNGSVNNLGVVSAITALGEGSFVDYSRRENRKCIAYTARKLQELGINVIDSSTNFLLFESTDYPGVLSEDLFNHGIKLGELTVGPKKWVRVSMGKMDDMKEFMETMQRIWRTE